MTLVGQAILPAAAFQAASLKRAEVSTSVVASRPRLTTSSIPQNHHLTTLAHRPYDEISRYFQPAADFSRPAFAQNMATRQFVFVRDISI
jgi:hypothetical protein